MQKGNGSRRSAAWPHEYDPFLLYPSKERVLRKLNPVKGRLVGLLNWNNVMIPTVFRLVWK